MVTHEQAPLDPVQRSRRFFLEAAAFAISITAAGLMLWPLAASIIAPAYQQPRRRFSKVGPSSDLPVGQPQRLTFPYVTVEGFIKENQTRDVWIIKHSDDNLTVFSPICTHLACRYDWNPESRHFVCPCHGSVFSINGKVLAGPAPRPLDTLPWKIEEGELYVEWEVFKSGIPSKEIV